jgi:hypothetical protein
MMMRSHQPQQASDSSKPVPRELVNPKTNERDTELDVDIELEPRWAAICDEATD